MSIPASELIINPDGSIYHLNLRPEQVADTILFVGDPDRVERITRHFSHIEESIQKREFKTQTGFYKGKRLSVISTGIGTDNIDIVMNELDALVNIDLKTRTPKEKLTPLNLIRIGTSGSLQERIPIDSFLLSTHGLDITGLLQSYQLNDTSHSAWEAAFIEQTQWSAAKATPVLAANDPILEKQLDSAALYKGITITASGFYGPQGRILRLSLQDPLLNDRMTQFSYQGTVISNLEMETAGIYGLARLLGHPALSLNAIIANRVTGEFSPHPYKTVDALIEYTLEKLIS